MPKCLLCFSEHVGEISEGPEPEWGCFECGAFGPSADDISSSAVEDRFDGQVYRVPTDDPEDVFVPGWS